MPAYGTSIEPSSVARASGSATSCQHSLYSPKEYGQPQAKQMQGVDARAKFFLPTGSDALLEDSETVRLQRQHRALNGALFMSSPPPAPSLDGHPERLAERKSPTREIETSQLNLFAGLERESDRSKLFSPIPTKERPRSPNVDVLEQKRMEHERQRVEQRKLFEEQMKMLELRQMREEQDLLQQHQTTQPSYATSSSASTTPPVLANDTRARSNTMPKLTLPSGNTVPSNPIIGALTADPYTQQRSSSSSRSMPTSRRNSNEAADKGLWNDMERLKLGGPDDQESEKEMIRSSLGRGSSLLRGPFANGLGDAANGPSSVPPQFNDNFLYDDDGDQVPNIQPVPASSALHRKYLALNTDDDKFPILVRRDSCPGMLSASSAALDLAPLAQTARHSRGLDPTHNAEWSLYGPHKPDGPEGEQLLSHSQYERMPPLFPGSQNSSPPSKRASLNLSTYSSDHKKATDSINGTTSKPVHRLATSYSSPDLSTASRLMRRVAYTPPNADILEEPASGSSLPNDVDLATSNVCRYYQQGVCTRGDRCQYTHNTPGMLGMTQNQMSLAAQMGFVPPMNPAVYGQYGVPAMGVYPTTATAAAAAAYNQNLATLTAALNGNSRIMMHNPKNAHKRLSGDLEHNRFAGMILDELVGEIYMLCKDQHGCRYLQKKLEERNEKYINVIFNEVFSHFVELMTDPFGNYLCQKLLEYSNDDQRTILIEQVAPELVNICLNMHGTRAVQRMIEFLTTPKQIQMVIVALNPNVVTLIKDLNGNHVIQKCLNRLSEDDNQFIYNAVADHCIEVSTHRHGCCVMQRCIDHATEQQKIQLATEITYHALTLVQDPYGNYVVQYVLDLGDRRFSDALIRRFVGSVCLLSVQKFSSNVMEKCIRVAEIETRKLLIDEMLGKTRLEKLLRDGYANYVVQTALDYAEPAQRNQLAENIRPLLPVIRNTPYGKRIQGKLHRDQQHLQAHHQQHQQKVLGTAALNMNNMLGFAPFAGGLGSFGNMGMFGLTDAFTTTPPSYPYI